MRRSLKTKITFIKIFKGEFFPLIIPELNQNILFLIEEIILILSYSIEIIEIPIL